MDSNGRRFWSTFALAILSLGVPAAAVALVIAVVGVFANLKSAQPVVVIPIVLLASVLAVVGGLTFLIVILSYLGLTTPGEALGLPDGSIRAIIALSLLFLFVIVSAFLYASLTDAAAASDIAKQLVTTVATLAVSVAGFYFGTASVQTAANTLAKDVPAVRIASPVGPQSLPRANAELPDIRVVATPGDQPLQWSISGDADGELAQTAPMTFKYRRGSKADNVVNLTFALANVPATTVILEVRAT